MDQAAVEAEVSSEELRERMIRKRKAIDLMELSFAEDAARFAATDDYDELGFVSAIDWIRFNCHMTSGAAADRVAVGKTMNRLPRSVEALAQGEIGLAHVTVMARTAEALRDRFDERALIEFARENSPGKFHFFCRHARHAADPDEYAAEEADQVHERRLSLSTWIDGSMVLSGVLDAFGGAALRAALEPLAHRSGDHDRREREQRLADALVELASGGPDRASLQVTTSVETLLGLAGGGCGHGVLASDLGQDRRAPGLRLQCDACSARLGLERDRRRTRQARGVRTGASRAQRPRWIVPLAGLRPAGLLERGASRRPLGPWRDDRPRQPHPALPPASLDGPRRQVAAGPIG